MSSEHLKVAALQLDIYTDKIFYFYIRKFYNNWNDLLYRISTKVPNITLVGNFHLRGKSSLLPQSVHSLKRLWNGDWFVGDDKLKGREMISYKCIWRRRPIR